MHVQKNTKTNKRLLPSSHPTSKGSRARTMQAAPLPFHAGKTTAGGRAIKGLADLSACSLWVQPDGRKRLLQEQTRRLGEEPGWYKTAQQSQHLSKPVRLQLLSLGLIPHRRKIVKSKVGLGCRDCMWVYGVYSLSVRQNSCDHQLPNPLAGSQLFSPTAPIRNQPEAAA